MTKDEFSRIIDEPEIIPDPECPKPTVSSVVSLFVNKGTSVCLHQYEKNFSKKQVEEALYKAMEKNET